MELSSSQIEEFEERGFLFFPELLKSHEVKLLTDHLEGLYSRTGPEVVREKKGDGIRLVYGTHEFCQPYGKLSVLPEAPRVSHKAGRIHGSHRPIVFRLPFFPVPLQDPFASTIPLNDPSEV